MGRYNRYYLPPDVLCAIPIEGLTPDQVKEAIDKRCEEERVAIAAAEAAQILQAAGVQVDAESLAHIRDLVQ